MPADASCSNEVELIGRYTPLQRALSYAWLGARLGLGGRQFPGIAIAYAITDDFAAAVINARLDSKKLPERLALKGRDAKAALALAGIRHIERTVRSTGCCRPPRMTWPPVTTSCCGSARRPRLAGAAAAAGRAHQLAHGAAIRQGLDHPMGPAPAGRQRRAADLRQHRQRLHRERRHGRSRAGWTRRRSGPMRLVSDCPGVAALGARLARAAAAIPAGRRSSTTCAAGCTTRR